LPAPFDPAAYPALTDLAGRLRELSGDSSYAAGRDYLRKGLVKQGAVAAGETSATAYATVSGSTDYRVSVSFGVGGSTGSTGAAPAEVKVTCTCPAHRRNRYCKHVVSLCVALLERPAEFTVGDAPPETHAPAAKRAPRAAGAKRVAKPSEAELRAAGLATVDRLLEELADGGLPGLGADKVALLAGAADLVRALKLRRLGNLLMALRHAAEHDRAALEGGAFARLLADLYATRRATGAHLEGTAQMEAHAAEDLLGKTWREDELEPVAGLDLLEVGYTRADDGEFRVETSYLAETTTGTLYAERQITPSRLRGDPKPRHRHRLVVEAAALYPGAAPRRIKLQRFRREPLTAAAAAGLVARLPGTVASARAVLSERLAEPFGAPDVPVTLRPAALLTRGGGGTAEGGRQPAQQGEFVQHLALDAGGGALALECPPRWLDGLAPLLPEPGAFALFGLLRLADDGPRLRCISALSGAFAWSDGPLYPE
jgi:hypothetical protein